MSKEQTDIAVTFDAKSRGVIIRALQTHADAQDRNSPVGGHEAACADYIRDAIEEANEFISEELVSQRELIEKLVEALKAARLVVRCAPHLDDPDCIGCRAKAKIDAALALAEEQKQP